MHTLGCTHTWMHTHAYPCNTPMFVNLYAHACILTHFRGHGGSAIEQSLISRRHLMRHVLSWAPWGIFLETFLPKVKYLQKNHRTRTVK